uniref:Solute carrier family 35, member F1/2 n=1 Tax=Tetraselmis sp. GSL018 TaxID=582737 RepID=A0A061RZ52_9CHLO
MGASKSLTQPGKVVAAIGLGQFCCVLLTVTGLTSHSLAELGVSLPATQSTLNYALLGISYGVAQLITSTPRKRPLWNYAVLALFDVEANCLVVMAYRYTSITSVSLSSAFSLPCAMLLSHWILRSRYRPLHLAGAAFGIVGLVYLVLSDAGHSGDRGSGPSPLLGDLLVIAGAAMYAGTNVVQEHLLGSAPLVEVMSRLGLFGTAFSLAQAALMEGASSLQIDWKDPAVAAPVAGYVVALFAYYNVEPLILWLGGSATLNLSLLTANCWDAAARFAFLGGFSGTTARDFALSLCLVAAGVLLYSLAGPVKVDAEAPGAGGKEPGEGEQEEEEAVPMLADDPRERGWG